MFQSEKNDDNTRYNVAILSEYIEINFACFLNLPSSTALSTP